MSRWSDIVGTVGILAVVARRVAPPQSDDEATTAIGLVSTPAALCVVATRSPLESGTT
jgi:hypothetical protein